MSTYSPKDVVVTFHGLPLSGYADGSFVEVARKSDSFSLVMGADGEAARTASADDSGTITVTLLQTSGSNDFLSSELALDELTKMATGPVIVQDLFGTTVCSSDGAFLAKPADVSMGKEVGERKWVIICPHLSMSVGGNL